MLDAVAPEINEQLYSEYEAEPKPSFVPGPEYLKRMEEVNDAEMREKDVEAAYLKKAGIDRTRDLTYKLSGKGSRPEHATREQNRSTTADVSLAFKRNVKLEQRRGVRHSAEAVIDAGYQDAIESIYDVEGVEKPDAAVDTMPKDAVRTEKSALGTRKPLNPDDNIPQWQLHSLR